MKATQQSRSVIGYYALLGGLTGLLVGCASVPPVEPTDASFDYFSRPDSDDPWSPKIAGWQRRETGTEANTVASPSDPEAERRFAAPEGSEQELRGKFADFRAERRRSVAREFATWIQSEAKEHYVADGPIDHWATLQETLERNGDDCDGLELLVFHGLRDLGFSEEEVFRAIVYRPSDGQHHMVTLWFEDPHDPWVIDPTGAMSSGMHRMSNIPGWQPLKVFSDAREFSARPLHVMAAR
jgi:hypothetical protein